MLALLGNAALTITVNVLALYLAALVALGRVVRFHHV